MKNKSIVLSGLLFIIVGIIPSCSDELYQTPVSSITGSSFWKTEDDANGALYGMYSRLRSQAEDNFFYWGEARSEDLAQSFGIATWSEYYFKNTLNVNYPGPTWSGMYTAMHDANLLLKNLPNISFKQESVKNNYLAQAYTTRAFLYFVMARTWGDLPLVTEPTEGYSADLFHRGRSSQEEIFKLIKSDLDNAINLFPNNSFPTGRNTWSKIAAQTLKADVYLWTAKRMGGGAADLNTALSALNEAEKGDMTLLDDFSRIFDYDNKGNSEIVMAIRFFYLESPNQTIYDEMGLGGGILPSNTDAETMAAIEGAPGGYAYWAIAPHIRSKFSDDDQRKKASFLEVYTVDDATGEKTFYTACPWKYNGIVESGVRRYFDDFVIYRLADIILMKAEVKNALGQDPTEEMNKIRKRAYKTDFDSHLFVNGSKDENDAAILEERLHEFLLEGKYWWDLIRFDKVFDLVPSLIGRGETDRYMLLWPISLPTLTSEPDVVQNPGW